MHSQKAQSEEPKGSLLLVHGLEGSSDGGYMRTVAQGALETGFDVHRMNIRGCGGTEALCNTLYHAGLTSDVRFVAKALKELTGAPIFLCGFSLGGNMVLKLAGELADAGPSLLNGVAAVSTPLDLKACARQIDRPDNWIYQRRFLRSMSDRLLLRQKLMPGVFRFEDPYRLRTIYDFDDRITAQFFGFGGAEGYYGTQSAKLFLESIRVPALLIQAKDDPMIPFAVYDDPAIAKNPHIRLLAVDHGGHVGFLAHGPSRFWLDQVIPAWMLEVGNKLHL